MTFLARNKRATHDYQIHERFEAGLALKGWETKGVMAGLAQITDSHVAIRKGEAWLVNCHIRPTANVGAGADLDPLRERKLLLHVHELRRLQGKVKRAGLTIVALDLHRSNGKIKANIALAKGKKLHDKRRAIKERDERRNRRY